MPYKSESIKLSPEQDRRRKLMDDDKDAIRILYSTGKYSMQQLANDFGVSKATVLLIVNPNSAQRNKNHHKAHWQDYRRTKEERAAQARSTRRYKQELFLAGELSTDKQDNNTEHN